MLLKNHLLAYFWANASIIYTTEDMEICLMGDDNQVHMSIGLTKDNPETIFVQLNAEFDIADFISYFELRELTDVEQISVETFLKALCTGKVKYRVINLDFLK